VTEKEYTFIYICYQKYLIISEIYDIIFQAKNQVRGGTRGRMYSGNNLMGNPSGTQRAVTNPEELKKIILSLPEIEAGLPYEDFELLNEKDKKEIMAFVDKLFTN